MSAAVDAADAPATSPLLSGDIIIEIFNVADWRTILSMRQVSSLWYELSKTWSIWATLVLRETLPKSDRPTLCYLDKPLEKYTSQALEALFKRWRTAERALQGGICRDPQIKSFKIPTRVTERLLLPGGRWLITFHGPCAFYLDLDARVPNAHILFPSQNQDPSPALLRHCNTCVQHDLNSETWSTGFNVFLAFSFFDEWISAWIVQVWKVESVDSDDGSSPGLRAKLGTTMKFRMNGNPDCVMCKSLTTDLLVLWIQDGQDTNDGYISLVEWQSLGVDPGFDFKRATVPNTSDERDSQFILVPRQPRLLVVTNTSVFLDDYLLVPHRHGHPTLAEAKDDVRNRRRKLLLSNSNSITQTFSRPYVFVRNPSIKNSPIAIRIVALNNYHGRLLGIEVEIPFADLGDNEANFSARYAHLGALPTAGLTGNPLLRHGHATARYRNARNVLPGINTYSWVPHWEVGKHNVKQLKALEALSGWEKFKYGELVDMDEGTARYVSSFSNHPVPMLRVIDFAA